MKENYINNPKFLYHGSPKLLKVIERRQAHDSNGNKDNEDYAIFLTSSYLIASAYAFKDQIKEISSDLEWNFNIGIDENGNEFVEMDNVRLDDEMVGYIYVVPYNSSFIYNHNSKQYKCYNDIEPIDVKKIKFKDFKQYYKINFEYQMKK